MQTMRKKSETRISTAKRMLVLLIAVGLVGGMSGGCSGKEISAYSVPDIGGEIVSSGSGDELSLIQAILRT